MKLKDTGLTAQDIKDKVNKYMIETYGRFDFLAETAEGMYLYDENGEAYLDFYAGIAEIVKPADGDMSKTNVFVKIAIRQIQKLSISELPKKLTIPFELEMEKIRYGS